MSQPPKDPARHLKAVVDVQKDEQRGSEEAKAQGGAGQRVTNSTRNCVLSGGPIGAYEAAAVGAELAAVAGVHGAGPFESNASMQRVLRHSEEEGEQMISMRRLQDLLAVSSGAPLPEAIAARMEQALGHDFSGVKVHTGGAAAKAADGIHAHAFAIGREIYFGSGELDLASPQGLELLAHELTHVKQHDEGRLPAPSSGESGVSDPSDPSEVEAVAVARDAMADLSAPVAASGAGAEETVGGGASAPSDTTEGVFREARIDAPTEGEQEELTEEQRRAIEAAEAARDTDVEPEEEEVEEAEESVEEEVEEPAPDADLPAQGDQEEEAPQLGGEGVTELPATLPEGSPPPANQAEARPTDQVVDHYMKVHWDRSDLASKTAEFGAYPDAIATETDRSLPVDTSPEVRAGANFLVGLGAGLMDGVFAAFAKSIPGLGAIAELAYGLKDGWKAVADAADHGDVVAVVLELIRAALDIVGGVAGNLGDLFTYTQNTAHVLAPFTLGVSEAVGVPAAGLANGCSAVQSFCHGALPVVDLALTIYHYIQGQNAEAAGQFGLQEWHKQRATDSAFRTAGSIIQAAFAWFSSGTAAVAPGHLPGTWGELLAEGGRKVTKSFGGFIGETDPDAVKGLFGRFAGEGRQIAGLFQGVTNTSVAMGFGDVMARSSDGFMGAHYIARQNLQSSGTRGATILGAAREQTLAGMDAGWESLEGEKPLWHQEVINKILSEEAGVGVYDMLNIALSPSEWIRLQFAGMRYIITAIGDDVMGGLAGLAGIAEAALTGIAQPFINNMSAWFQENKPALDELLTQLNEKIQRQTVTLETLRNVLDQATEYVSHLGNLADAGGAIDQAVEPMLASIHGMHITAESLGIPGWVPAISYEWAINGINGALDRAASMVTSMKDGALEQLDQGLEASQEWIQGKIDFFQEAFQAGGELETMLQDELTRAQEMSQQVTEAFTTWDGDFSVDFSGAAAFLTSIAENARANLSEAKQEKWKEYVSTVAQVYVEDWKSRHADAVYQNFWPSMPPGEIAAVQEVYQMVSENLDAIGTSASDARRAELEEAYQACMAFHGQEGREALEGLWAAEERLARIALEPLPEEEEEEGGDEGEDAPDLTPVDVHFAFDRPKRGDNGFLNPGQVESAVELARQADGEPVSLVGHASVEGSDAYNLQLGQRRADAVAIEISRQVPGASVAASSVGESEAGNDEESANEAWRKVVVNVDPREGG